PILGEFADSLPGFLVRAHGALLLHPYCSPGGEIDRSGRGTMRGSQAGSRTPLSDSGWTTGVLPSIGRLRRNTAPPPGRFSAQIRPPCASRMPWLIVKPSPTPRVPG